ncbi:hypothetical protein [Nostoc sp.]
MSKFFLLHEKVLLFSEKNETSVAASDYFSLLSEMKTFIKELLQALRLLG